MSQQAEQKLQPYDVHMSLDAMHRAALAKKDKEHMKLCMEEVQKRKKQLATIMKDMDVKKATALKQRVVNRLVKAFEARAVDNERAELLAIDVLLKAAQSESEEVIVASGTQVISDPTATKEVKFAGNLFQDYRVGSSINSSPNGAVLTNAKKPSQDYVQTAAKTNQKTYSEEQLKVELTPKKV
jgi:hypothetical protein